MINTRLYRYPNGKNLLEDREQIETFGFMNDGVAERRLSNGEIVVYTNQRKKSEEADEFGFKDTRRILVEGYKRRNWTGRKKILRIPQKDREYVREILLEEIFLGDENDRDEIIFQ